MLYVQPADPISKQIMIQPPTHLPNPINQFPFCRSNSQLTLSPQPPQKSGTHLSPLIIHPNNRLGRLRILLLRFPLMMQPIPLRRGMRLGMVRDPVALFALLHPGLGRAGLGVRVVASVGFVDAVRGAGRAGPGLGG